jgi:hypothetical protein
MFAETLIIPQQVAEAVKAKRAAKKSRRKSASTKAGSRRRPETKARTR